MNSVYPQQETFYWLKHPTIAEIRAVLNWAHARAMKTHIFCSDRAKMVRKQASEKSFEEVVRYINRESKPFFRVIFRKDMNWFLLLSDKLHIKDMLEIGICGIGINGEEYFIHSYLKKEMLPLLKKKFSFQKQED